MLGRLRTIYCSCRYSLSTCVVVVLTVSVAYANAATTELPWTIPMVSSWGNSQNFGDCSIRISGEECWVDFEQFIVLAGSP